MCSALLELLPSPTTRSLCKVDPNGKQELNVEVRAVALNMPMPVSDRRAM